MFLRALILLPLCLWALSNWWYAGREIIRVYVNLPVWDYFDMVEHYARLKAGDLKVLWTQHNEHRIVFPEIIFLTDMFVFHGRIIFSTVVSFCAYFGVWLTMVWALGKERHIATIPRYGVIFLAATLIAWKGCSTALGTPFLLAWTMNQFFTIISLALLAKLSGSEDSRWLFPLCACAIVATYSAGNGMSVFPLLVCYGMYLRLPRSQVLTLAAVGALSIGLYFVGYLPLGSINWRNLIDNPIYYLKFMASYLSMPFAVLRAEPEFGVKVGLASLASSLGLLILAWRAKLLKTTTGIVLFGYMAWIIGSGTMTALGRMNPADPLWQSPKAVRYMTLPLTYWGALAIVSVWVGSRFWRFFGTAVASTVVVGLSLLLFRMSHKPKLDEWYEFVVKATSSEQQWAALAVKNGVLETVPDGILFADPGFVPRVVPTMRQEKLSPFSDPQPYWIGRSLREVFPTPPLSTSQGGIAVAQAVGKALTLAGWTNIDTGRTRRVEVVLADENNRIVGLGERLSAGLPSRFDAAKIDPAKQWAGFVNPQYHSRTVTAYVLASDSRTLVRLPNNAPLSEGKQSR